MHRIAIIGTGAIADSHIQAYARCGAPCAVAALVDLYPEKARAKAAKHGLNAAVFKSCDEMLAAGGCEAASVCLPPFEHAAATITLLRACVHVLVEKPMAVSLQECDAMIAAAAESGAVLAVVSQNRFTTPMVKLKCILEAGLIGKLLHARADSFWWRGGNYYDLWWRGTWEREGGGCTMNHAVHHIDLFLWLAGAPAEVRAVCLNLCHDNSEVEDFASALLRYPNGAVGQLTASLVHHGEEQQLVFQGERAAVGLPWRVKASRQRENGFPEDDPALAAEINAFRDRVPPLSLEGHDGQVANFVAAIEGREALWVDGAEGRRAIELIAAIYQSSCQGRPVALPLAPADPFYTREGIMAHAPRFHEKRTSLENFAADDITFGRDFGL